MLVSASFLSSKNIPEDIKKLDQTNVDFIHVDVMDGKYVENKTMPFKEMRHIYKFTNKRLDVHLMVKEPSKYIDDYASLNTEFITIESDIDEDLLSVLKQIKSYAIKTGLAVNPDVLVKDIVPYLPYLDLLLIMGVTPGKGGQEFQEGIEEKIKEARILLESYPNFSILLSVDGGINKETRKKVDACDIVVSGSYILKNSNYQDAINSLR